MLCSMNTVHTHRLCILKICICKCTIRHSSWLWKNRIHNVYPNYTCICTAFNQMTSLSMSTVQTHTDIMQQRKNQFHYFSTDVNWCDAFCLLIWVASGVRCMCMHTVSYTFINVNLFRLDFIWIYLVFCVYISQWT